ncbi:MAG: AAA family ATPase, partial [Planctomycetia bacterium]
SSAVFVVATANSLQNLPPELLRKGRLDEIFFVDLPNAEERREVFRLHLAKRRRAPDAFDLKELVELSAGFSGAEIEQAIISALFDVFGSDADGDLTTKHLAKSLLETVPLSKTMSEDLNRLRQWAQGRARPSSRKSAAPETTETRRRLEL